jgi:hypothetical protein
VESCPRRNSEGVVSSSGRIWNRTSGRLDRPPPRPNNRRQLDINRLVVRERVSAADRSPSAWRAVRSPMSQDRRSAARSRADLARWAATLYDRWGLSGEYGFHLVEWEHDDGCPLNPTTNPRHKLASRCRCQPNGKLVLHLGTVEQRRIPVVRDGIALPVRSSACR